jgi:hypothetical protein
MRAHPLRLLEKLAAGEADHLVAQELGLGIAGAVGLEGGPVAMGLPAVGRR